MQKIRDLLLVCALVGLVVSVLLNTGHVAQDDTKAGILFGAIDSAVALAFFAIIPSQSAEGTLHGFLRLRLLWARGDWFRTGLVAFGMAVIAALAWSLGVGALTPYRFVCEEEQAVTWRVVGLWDAKESNCKQSPVVTIWVPTGFFADNDFRCIAGDIERIATVTKNVVKCPATPLETVWQGIWKRPDGFVFSFVMNLDIGSDNAASGKIRWQLVKSPVQWLRAREGHEALEFVEGTFDRQERFVHIKGTRVTDSGLISTDEYKLQILSDNVTFKGMTHSQNPWEASAEGLVVISRKTFAEPSARR